MGLLYGAGAFRLSSHEWASIAARFFAKGSVIHAAVALHVLAIGRSGIVSLFIHLALDEFLPGGC